ncbi:MAG: carbamate kinase [Acidilobaceae archaeon]
MLLVVALGGNAITPRGSSGSPREQWEAVSSASRALASLVEEGFRLVVTHGNGPQVGYLMEAFDLLPPGTPRQTLDLAVAMTQGWIGFLIAHSLERELARRGLRRRVAVVPTRVLVSLEDPEFSNPSKYIGRYYGEEEAVRVSRELGWVMRRDPRGGYRRVVPSPRPLGILEVDVVRSLIDQGYIVVAAGGGGIPVAVVNGSLEPVEAVVDKDLTSSLLALELNADSLVILTDVPGVAVNYRRPGELWLRRVKVSELKKYYEDGEFPSGSMGPKVLAAINFVERTGRRAHIGLLDEALEVVKGLKGTVVEP